MTHAPSLRRRLFGTALLLLALLLGAGCEDGSLNAPDIRGGTDGDSPLFESYVALGNSITAGFQAGGINATTQRQSYAAILAESMNTPFGIPALNPPGCPPPLTQLFNDRGVPDPQRIGGASDTTCALRDARLPDRVRNVAVPAAGVVDVVSNDSPLSSPNVLTQFVLGGRTQIEAALDANPTFATVWVGNNDVLRPAQAGTDDVTPVANFSASYSTILDRLTSQPQFAGGVLVGVANVTFAPFFSPGSVYATLEQAGALPSTFDVASSCEAETSTGLTPLVPVDFGLARLAQAQAGESVTLDCQAADTPVLTLDEVGTLVQTVRQYNAFIEDQAQQRGLAFFDPNTVFRALYTNDDGDRDPTNDLIPKFPALSSDAPFGAFFSLDGIHPSTATHRVVAAELVETINETYGTDLQPPSNRPSLPSNGGGP